MFTQQWLQICFVHWAVDPDVVAPLLPRGVVPDTFDGATHVGLIPFHMRRIGFFGGPPVPWCGPASVSLSSLRRNSGSTSR